MKRLAILRHAKSSWDDPKLDDFNRPLNDRGWKDARRMGRELKHRNMRFDLVLASTAARVRETIDGVQEKYDFDAEVRFEPRIYSANTETLLSLVQGFSEDVKAPLLVGHNPGLEQLIELLGSDDPKGLRAGPAKKFPTCAFAALELDVERWTGVGPRCGKIVELILPKELD